MYSRLINEKTDLSFLKWSHSRQSSGTAGTFLKSQSNIDGVKKYYKISNFDPIEGIIGHECVNELIVDRLLTILGVEHLSYELINAEIEIEGRKYNSYICASEDFKKKGESKTALDNYYKTNANPEESHYEFCVRNGWRKYIDTMIAVDYLILNRDRHGANIEVLRNSRAHTIRIAPLFDHGLSLIYSCQSEKEAATFNVLEDRRVQSFIGGHSCYKNLDFIKDKKTVFKNKLEKSDRGIILEGLEYVLPTVYLDTIWNMIWERYKIYESL